ncbi:MAG: DUF2071 domain-containing protein [Planctomycetaceae bacterium]|nr:DUF2071 domain-containing protein [Planctomycetaceae bacterium]
MRLPVLFGVIERRLLVNFRVDFDVLARVVPPPFRPQSVGGWGLGGICLIRLGQIRPRGWPTWLGLGSENAAHRIAVEWDEPGGTRSGVFVHRRDTNSRLNAAVGGRIFPGVHHRAQFDVCEHQDCLDVGFRSLDGAAEARVRGSIAADLPRDSVFASLAEASDFFRTGVCGYSPGPREGVYDGLELRALNWEVTPLQVEHVFSSYFADAARFPAGSVAFDCALLMRNIRHEWRGLPDLCGAGYSLGAASLP